MAIIDKPTDYFNTKLYTGTSGTISITGLDFQPDFVWCKNRTSANRHALFDSIRGATYRLRSDGNDAEAADPDTLTSFNSDGFTVGADAEAYGVNNNGNAFASWNFKAGGTASSNTDGSITSSVSANATSGFSIVSYTGTNANATVGHGLGVAPKVIILKNRDTTNSWCVGHGSLGFDKFLNLNETAAAGSDATYRFQGTSPSSTVFSVGAAGETNGSSQKIIAYCFADTSMSKMGSYTGNGSTDGTFVYTGFKPAMIIAKQSTGGQGWQIHDTTRDTFNLATKVLFPNSNSAEQNSSANGALDILSNGFKWRMADADQNGSGSTYIYMAFAENPFVTSTGVPATAR